MFLKKIKVSDNHTVEILKLIDKKNDDKNNKFINHYNLWLKVEEYYPETKIGQWQIERYGSELFLIQTKRKTKYNKIKERN